MLKALWFLFRLALLTAAVVWCAQNPGTVEINWRGYAVDTSTGFVAVVLAVFLFLYTMLHRLWRNLLGTPDLWRRYLKARRREIGYRAVTAGLVAVAAGDARGAERHARLGEKLIPDAPLSRLLLAQTHLLRGDTPRARLAFAALADDDNAAFFGVKALLQEALRTGDRAAALEQIRRADTMQPGRDWVVKTLFDLEARDGNWARARAALDKCARLHVFSPADVLIHRQALLLAAADEAAAHDQPVRAHKQAARAFGMNPAFIPAALRLVKFYTAVGKTKSAQRVLLRAFAAAPHPGLAQAWMDLRPAHKIHTSPYREGKAVYDWARRLYDTNPGPRDSLRMLGAAALDAGRFAEARDLLTRAEDCAQLARLERLESGSETKSRAWLEKAAAAPPDPVWACLSCGKDAGGDWAPLCPQCGAFNGIVWVVPRSAVYALPPKADDFLPAASGFSL